MSIQKLVAPLGISTKTVYKYFKNKEELLEKALHLYYTHQYQLLEEMTADHKAIPLFLDIWYIAFEKAYKVTNTFHQDLKYYYPELDNKIQAGVGEKFAGQFNKIIQKGIDEGVFREGIYPKVIMETIYVLYEATTRTDRFKPFRVSAVDVLLHTIVTYIRGFCTSKGIAELEEHIQAFQPFGKSKKVNGKTVQSLINQ